MAISNNKTLIVRCFAFSEKNEKQRGFYAMCIDLSLFTWRPTLKEARSSLNDAIEGYLDTACKLAKEEKIDIEDMSKYVLRPAHFWPYKARYYMFKFLNSIKKNKSFTFNNPVNMSVFCQEV